MKKAEAYWPLILLLALVKFVLPLFLQSAEYELHRDEYLYYEQGQHLALGYLENPPILSWMGTISSWLGGSMSVIKFWPCLLGALTVILTCLLTAELGGNRVAQFLAGLAMMTGAYMRVHFLFQPNSLDVFFWTLVIYFLVRYINSLEPRFIYWMAIAIGLGWWGKYSILFMVVALIAGLLLTYHRKIFTRKETWIGLLLALAIMAPNLWWQYAHNWPLVHHMKELNETQLTYVSKTEFLKEQLMMLLPAILIWIAGLIWLFNNKTYRVIGIIYVVIIGLLVLGNGKGYYALGAYPMLFAAGAVAWEALNSTKKWVAPLLTGVVLAFSILAAPHLLPIWEPKELAEYFEETGGKSKWEDQELHALPQDYADMLGWKELSDKTEKAYKQLPDSMQCQTLVFCGSYGQAGALLYYKGQAPFCNKLVSFNGSFLLWLPEDLSFRHLLLVNETVPGEEQVLFNHFEKRQILDSVTNPLSRQLGNKIILYSNIDEEGLQMAAAAREARRNKFR